jgi:hypothetical protein
MAAANVAREHTLDEFHRRNGIAKPSVVVTRRKV